MRKEDFLQIASALEKVAEVLDEVHKIKENNEVERVREKLASLNEEDLDQELVHKIAKDKQVFNLIEKLSEKFNNKSIESLGQPGSKPSSTVDDEFLSWILS